MNSAFTALRQKLLELVILLKTLSPNQFTTLTRFEQCDINILSPTMDLSRTIESVGDAEFEWMVASATKPVEELRSSPNSHGSLSKEQLLSFRCLLHLVLLQEMITIQFTISHLMKLTEIIPQIPPDHQLKLLQQLQQWLFSIDSRRLEETWRDYHDPTRSPQDSLLFQDLMDHQDRFSIEQPLQGILSFEDWDETRQMCEGLTQLHPPQLVQLVRLLQYEPLQILEIRQFLSHEGWKGLQSLLDDDPTEPPDPMFDDDQYNHEPHIEPTPRSAFSEAVSLSILEQPPEQTVYKRNLKPFPAILVQGDERLVLQPGESLVVAPMLYRYDNLEPVLNKISGVTPLPVTTGATVVFKKLKIMVTSNQLNNTLFFLQFELRKVSQNKAPETLAFLQSNPIFVVSHTTLLKKPISPTIEAATISEVIPPKGTSEGGTKVAILGDNFVDTPNTRVWFDLIEVKPQFHGPKTLTCITPRHEPGHSIVCVSNTPQHPRSSSHQAHPSPLPEGRYTVFTFEPSSEENLSPVTGKSVPLQNSFPFPEGFDEFLAMDHSSSSSSSTGLTTGPPGDSSSSGFGSMFFDSLKLSLQNQQNHLINDDIDVNDVNDDDDDDDEKLMIKMRMIHQRKVNSLDERGYAPLHYSVAAGDVAGTCKLLELGANPDLLDKHGNSPLYWAVFFSHEELVSILGVRSSGLNRPNPQDGEGLLHLASGMYGSARIVFRLIQLGARLDLVSGTQGHTALHNACAIGDLQSAYCLLRFGAFLNAEDAEGETALHWAVREGCLDSVRLLLQVGVDVNHQNEDGETALHLAIECEFLDAVKLILENPRMCARLDVLDGVGVSSLKLAVMKGNPEIQKAFIDHGVDLTVGDSVGEKAGFRSHSSCAVDDSKMRTLNSFKYDGLSLLHGYLLSV